MNFLERSLTKAWQNRSPALTALAPLSAAYGLATGVRKSLYHKGKFAQYRAAVPVLVVGNITVGGSGKTPLIIALVAYLQGKGVPVGVISRGYGRDSKLPMLVEQGSLPFDVGDEPALIKARTGVPLAVAAQRGQAIDVLLHAHPDIRLIISDDGLQHYALHRDAEWIVVDGVRGFGNGKLLPQGFLREPITRLDGATVIYHDPDAAKYPADEKLMHLAASELVSLFGKLKPLKPQRVYAVCGIGYPERFFTTLRGLGFDVMPKPFGDHHRFSLADISHLTAFPIIMTEKDAVKIRPLFPCRDPLMSNIWVLPVQAVLSPSVYDELDRLLLDLNILQKSP